MTARECAAMCMEDVEAMDWVRVVDFESDEVHEKAKANMKRIRRILTSDETLSAFAKLLDDVQGQVFEEGDANG